jgi:hypothetical protein
MVDCLLCAGLGVGVFLLDIHYTLRFPVDDIAIRGDTESAA